MKVALVQPPVWWTIDPPLGLAQMAGCAMQYGHEVHVFDLNILLWKSRSPKYHNLWLWEQSHFWNDPRVVADFFEDNKAEVERHVQSILRTGARVVCFSISLGSHMAGRELARMIKKEAPSSLIIMGGQYFFLDESRRRSALSDLGADVVVQGGADHLFPRLLGDLELHGGPRPIPGLLYRNGGEIVDMGAAEPLRDLDGVPFADFSKFPMELYEDQGRIPMAASRGCVWACRFCSTREFWPLYSYMGGERIYAEILYHRRMFPHRFHVDFYDITANGKPESLRRFSDLVIENEARTAWMHFGWKINAIIRPEMDRDLLGKMARANCREIIYGIESGSPKVLKRMNKHYKPEIAERVLRDTHESGIKAVGNFMFGYPGETEEDFQITLDFLRRNHGSFDRVYASATFTSLEEHSYLTDHQEEFGIAPRSDQEHSLYWKSLDGQNTYLVRLDRYRRFRTLAGELGIDAYKGTKGALDLDNALNSANYLLYENRPFESIKHFARYFEMDPENEPVRALAASLGPAPEWIWVAVRCLERADALADEATSRKGVAEAIDRFGRSEDPVKLRREALAWFRDARPPAAVRWAIQGLYRLAKAASRWTRAGVAGDGSLFIEWGSDRIENFSEAKAVLEKYLNLRLRREFAAVKS